MSLIVSHILAERDIESESFAKVVWENVLALITMCAGENKSSDTLLSPLRHNISF